MICSAVGVQRKEVIHVREILLADYILPKLALDESGTFYLLGLCGIHLVHLMDKQKLF